MDFQNLAYALIQVLHNFGAAAVLGISVTAWRRSVAQGGYLHRHAWLTALAWAIQGITGGAFGAVSFYYYGHFPDIHGIAVAALLLKMTCVVTGFSVAAAYFRFAPGWSEPVRVVAWKSLAALGGVALTAAAFLRWFS